MADKLIQQLVDAYIEFPIDEESLLNFSLAMFQKINLYRIKTVSSSDEDADDATHMNESHCNAFYRMLGLPIVSVSQDFYNPGYYGSDMTADANKIKKINSGQHSNLKNIEEKRERKAFEYSELFLSQDTDALQYKLDMLKYPRKILAMKEDLPSPFANDDQSEILFDRSENNRIVYHILRPFKCNATISSVDKIRVPSKNLAAPFFENNVDKSIIDYQKTYLETVCRVRFAKSAITTVDPIIQALLDKLELVQINGTNIFQNVLNNPNIIEVYVLDVLIGTFIKTVLLYGSKIKEYKNLANKLSEDSTIATTLSYKIQSLQENLAYYEAIQRFLPTDVNQNKGHLTQSNNLHNGVLLSELMSIINVPAAKISKDLDSANKELENHRRDSLNINEDRFYLSGEVLGIGTIDILALMLAFWTISPEALVSLLDDSSFSRLYNGRLNNLLKHEVVEQRNDAGEAPKGINDAIKEFDSAVYNLLALANSIIEYNNREISSS